MAQRIILAGGIEDDHDRTALLAMLSERENCIEWEWHKTVFTTGHRLSQSNFNRLRAEQSKKGDIKIVMLRRLNKRDQSALIKLFGDPVRADKDFATGEELVNWLLSPAAGLVPPRTWVAKERVATFFCVLAKLLSKRSWNKDRHGHTWTQEVHLLGDAPVDVHSGIRKEAPQMLARLNGTLLLDKGGSDTPKEWCINSRHLPTVKNAFLQQRLTPLEGIEGVQGLLNYLNGGNDRDYQLDEFIQVERVRAVCREQGS
jgi:hypothetical protein